MIPRDPCLTMQKNCNCLVCTLEADMDRTAEKHRKLTTARKNKKQPDTYTTAQYNRKVRHA